MWEVQETWGYDSGASPVQEDEECLSLGDRSDDIPAQYQE